MKKYTLRLKGTKKHNTPDIEVIILGDSKSQAFNWAYLFFEKGEFEEPYTIPNTDAVCEGTCTFIPGANSFKMYAGKYKVFHSSITPIKVTL